MFLVGLILAGFALVTEVSSQDKPAWTVVSTIVNPFLTEKANANNLTGNDRYEGYMADLLQAMAKNAGVEYTIRLVPDGQIGAFVRGHSTGSGRRWNGLMGELLDRKADLAVGPMTLTSLRQRVVDFTSPFMTSGIGLLMRKSSNRSLFPHRFAILPFSIGSLGCVLVCAVGVVILFYMISRFDPYERHSKGGEDDHNCGILGALWLICGGLVLQGYSKRPSSTASFILIGSWWIFCLILFATYLATMPNRGKNPPREEVSTDDVIKNEDVTLLALNMSATSSFLCNSMYKPYYDACKRLVLVNNTEEGLSMVTSGGHAMLIEIPFLKYITSRRCDLTQVGSPLTESYYSLATPLRSSIFNTLEYAVNQLRETGVVDTLEKKWWSNPLGGCTQANRRQEGSPISRQVELIDLGYLFSFLFVGICLAAVAMVIEVLYFLFKGKKANVLKEDANDEHDSVSLKEKEEPRPAQRKEDDETQEITDA